MQHTHIFWHSLVWHVCNYPNVLPFQFAFCCLCCYVWILTNYPSEMVNSRVSLMQGMIILLCGFLLVGGFFVCFVLITAHQNCKFILAALNRNQKKERTWMQKSQTGGLELDALCSPFQPKPFCSSPMSSILWALLMLDLQCAGGVVVRSEMAGQWLPCSLFSLQGFQGLLYPAWEKP